MLHDTHRIFSDYMAVEDLLREATTPEDKQWCEAMREQFSKEYSLAWHYWLNRKDF